MPHQQIFGGGINLPVPYRVRQVIKSIKYEQKNTMQIGDETKMSLQQVFDIIRNNPLIFVFVGLNQEKQPIYSLSKDGERVYQRLQWQSRKKK